MELCIIDRRERSWSRERIEKDDGRDVDFRKRELDSAAPPSVWVDRVWWGTVVLPKSLRRSPKRNRMAAVIVAVCPGAGGRCLKENPRE